MGLFNEINPVYVSLNMGRSSDASNDDYTTQDKFKQVKREAAQLCGRFMMVNFLKCDGAVVTADKDKPANLMSLERLIGQDASVSSQNESIENIQEYVLRIIAFEDETSAQFKLDLYF